jgi:nitrate reductase beta subunit
VKACPYKKVYFNAQTRVSEKCIGCYPAVEGGRQTQCTITCIGKIRLQGFMSAPDKPNEDNPIDYLVLVKKLALPLYPQLGLEPNTYYIPPIHVPAVFLRQMFGWGVEQAVALYRKAAEDRKLLGALTLLGATPEISHYFRVHGDEVVGYDGKQSEIVRVPLKEPVVIREVYDIRHKAYRTNIT